MEIRLSSCLIVFGLLDYWLAWNFFRVLTLCNEIRINVVVIRIHDPIIQQIKELRCLQQCVLFEGSLSNFLPQSYVIVSFKSMSLSFESVRWLMYSLCLIQTPRGHFTCVVIVIFELVFLSFQDAITTFPEAGVTMTFRRLNLTLQCLVVQFSI